MGIAEKFNKGSKFTFKTDLPENVSPNFMGAKELTEEKDTLVVRSFYLNKKGNFDHYVVICTGEHYDQPVFLDAPQHMNETFEAMYKDDEAVEAINAGKLGISGYEYQSDKRKEPCYGLQFADL